MKDDDWIQMAHGRVGRKYFKEAVKWAKMQQWNLEKASDLRDDEHKHCEICSLLPWKDDKKYTDGKGDYLCESCYNKFVK